MPSLTLQVNQFVDLFPQWAFGGTTATFDALDQSWHHVALSHFSMTYALSFSPRFFYTGKSPENQEARRPTSVEQAILNLSQDQWNDIARDVFGLPPKRLEVDMVLDKVIQTDTCLNLDSPVEVWIDETGDHVLTVFDERATEARIRAKDETQQGR